MNINAINELSMKKNNFRLREANPQPTTPEPTTKEPEKVMNALYIQGMNNVAFKSNPAKMAQLAKNLGKKAAVALPLLVGGAVATTTTSCDPDFWNPQPIVYPLEVPNQKDTTIINVEVNNQVTVNIDLDTETMNAWLEKLYNQNQISQEQNAKWQAEMMEIIKKYANDASTYQGMMLELAKQIVLSTQTTADNTTEIKVRIEDVEAMVAKGLVTLDEALKMLSNINEGVGVINSWLKDLYEQNKISDEQHAAWHQKMIDVMNTHRVDSKEYQKGMIEIAKLIATYSMETAGNTAELNARMEDVEAMVAKGLITMDEAIKMLSNINEGVGVINSWLKDLYEQNKISDEQHAAWHQKIVDVMNTHRVDSKEYQKGMIEIAKLIATYSMETAGNTAELNARMAEIEKMLANGQITLDEAVRLLAKLDGRLEGIQNSLDNIYKNQNKQLEAEERTNEILENIYTLGKLNFEEIAELGLLVQDIANNVETVKGNTHILIDIIKDPARHNELIETIKNSVSNPIEFEKFEAMFKFYGLTIADAVTMSADQLEAALKTFMEKYETTEAAKQADLNAKLDEISEKISKLLDKVGSLSNDLNTYYQIFDGYWTDALNYLENISKDVAGLKDLQKEANKMLNALLKKAGEFEELLKDNQGMTVDEFKAALQERDQRQYEKWVKFTIDMGLDKLAGDVATIKDYVAAMKGKLDGMKDYSAQLDRIIAKLDGIDLTAEENQEILKAIENAIKNHKCDCNCGDNGNHEGILGDVEDALNGLV